MGRHDDEEGYCNGGGQEPWQYVTWSYFVCVVSFVVVMGLVGRNGVGTWWRGRRDQG